MFEFVDGVWFGLVWIVLVLVFLIVAVIVVVIFVDDTRCVGSETGDMEMDFQSNTVIE